MQDMQRWQINTAEQPEKHVIFPCSGTGTRNNMNARQLNHGICIAAVSSHLCLDYNVAQMYGMPNCAPYGRFSYSCHGSHADGRISVLYKDYVVLVRTCPVCSTVPYFRVKQQGTAEESPFSYNLDDF